MEASQQAPRRFRCDSVADEAPQGGIDRHRHWGTAARQGCTKETVLLLSRVKLSSRRGEHAYTKTKTPSAYGRRDCPVHCRQYDVARLPHLIGLGWAGLGRYAAHAGQVLLAPCAFPSAILCRSAISCSSVPCALSDKLPRRSMTSRSGPCLELMFGIV